MNSLPYTTAAELEQLQKLFSLLNPSNIINKTTFLFVLNQFFNNPGERHSWFSQTEEIFYNILPENNLFWSFHENTSIFFSVFYPGQGFQ